MDAANTFAYPADFRTADGTVLVSFPDLPEALTEGGDAEDAMAQAVDCLDEAIAGRIADRGDIPRPSPVRGRDQRLVVVPQQTAVKAALYLAMGEAGLSNVRLAKRLDCDEKEVRRMLDPRHATRMERMREALAACGKQVQITVCDIAPRARNFGSRGGTVRPKRAARNGRRRA